MNPGFCQDLTALPDGLLTVLEDRGNCADVPVVHQFTGARHGALALEEIARAVAYRQIGTTVREHAGVLALAGLAGVVARADQAPPASGLVRELAAHG